MTTADGLAFGYTDLPPGTIAAIATSLEMRERPEVRPTRWPEGVSLHRIERPGVDWYRDLFRRIGEPWLWQSRLRMDPAMLEGIIRSPDVEIWAVRQDGRDEGLAELDFRLPGECELAFFGLTAGLVGHGVGRSLMSHAVERAWTRPITRFWVHTCTFDHPGALAFYMRSGFVAYRRQLELAPDPRLDGTLSPGAAPFVPVLPD